MRWAGLELPKGRRFGFVLPRSPQGRTGRDKGVRCAQNGVNLDLADRFDAMLRWKRAVRVPDYRPIIPSC